MNIRTFQIIVIAGLLPLNVLGKACSLKYEKNVSNKPTIFLPTAIHSSICGIQNDEMNTVTEWNDANSNIRGINYDAHQMRLLYLTSNVERDSAKLNVLNFKDNQSKVAFDQSKLTSIDGIPLSKGIEITDMAYDWISKNAYLNLRDFVVAVNVENPSQDATKILSDVKHILSLAVHPNAGYLFYVDANIIYTKEKTEVKSTIYRAHLDGSNAVPLIQSNDYIISLAIDFYKDRLYWATPSQSLIEHSKLDGTDVRTLGGRKVRFNMFNDGSRSIDVDKDFIYYLPANSSSVRRIRKSDKQEDVDFHLINDVNYVDDSELNLKLPNFHIPISEILVFDSKRQNIRENHPCAFGNGSCEKFCFALPKNNDLPKVCKCADGEKLADDGESCER